MKRKAAAARAAPKRKAAKPDMKAEIRAEVVGELKPYIAELFESVRTEIQDLRAEVGTPREAAPAAAAAAPPQIDIGQVSSLLKGSGLGDDQIGKLTNMFNQMQAANQQQAGGAAPAGGAAHGGAAAPPQMPGGDMLLKLEVLKTILPLIMPQQNPMMAEVMQRTIYDTLAFNAMMHRKVMMQNLGAPPAEIAQAVNPYLQANAGLINPMLVGAANAGMQPGQTLQANGQAATAATAGAGAAPVPGAAQ